jgi:hypothetical protein
LLTTFGGGSIAASALRFAILIFSSCSAFGSAAIFCQREDWVLVMPMSKSFGRVSKTGVALRPVLPGTAPPAWTALPDGAKVTFDIVPNRGNESAENLRVK